jgi:hypothetical protein
MVTASLTDLADTRTRRAPRSYQLLLRAVDRPHAVLWITGFAFVMSLPALATGLAIDDYVIEASVKHDPWSGFVFHPRDPAARVADTLAKRHAGQLPWWTDAHVHQAFFRPLASLTHALDFRVWPNAVWWMHLESIAVFTLIVWLAGLVYTELGLPRAVLGLATFFYAMSGNHAMSVGWLSGRNTLMAAAFGLFAVWLHLRAASRLGRSRFWLQLMAAAALGCGLLSGEFAAGAAGFLLAHALTLRDGGFRRLLALWPYAIVLAIWQGVYIAGHYGAIGSGFYHGPGQAPGSFALSVVTGVPIYLATQLMGPIATFSCILPNGLVIVTAVSLVSLFLMRRLLVPLLREERRARFLLLGSALSAIPLGSTAAQDRLVFFVSFGTAAVVAMLVVQRFDPTNVALSGSRAARLWRIHGVYLPIMFVPMLFSMASVTGAGGGATRLADRLPTTNDRGVVLLGAPIAVQVSCQDSIREHRGLPRLPFIDLLYAGGQPFEVSRPTDRSLELQVERGYLATSMEQFERNVSEHPFRAGDSVQLARLRATVLAVNGSGAPTRVRFEWNAALEQLDYAWLTWDGRAPKPWPVPSVGSPPQRFARPGFF